MASPSLKPEKVTIVMGLKEVLPVTSIFPILYLSILFCEWDISENRNNTISIVNLNIK